MTWKKVLSLTGKITLLVFITVLVVYAFIWWITFDKKFYSIEQFRSFILTFIVPRWYDFGLICLWPLIIVPINIIYKKDDVVVFGVFGLICAFITIGLPLTAWINSADVIYLNVSFVLVIIGWIITEFHLFTMKDDNQDKSKSLINQGFIVNVLAGLGVALSFVFSKGLLIGLFFGLSVTVILTVLLLIYNLIFKPFWRLIFNHNQNKKLITKAE